MSAAMLGVKTHRLVHECSYGCCTLVASSDARGRRLLKRRIRRQEKRSWQREVRRGEL